MRLICLIVLFTIYFSGICHALPEKAYLPVPFLCQAPDGDWSQPWQDGCEEAAIIMAIHYIYGNPVNREAGNQEILDMVKFQNKNYGGHYDLTAEQMGQLIKDYYDYKKFNIGYKEVNIGYIKEQLAEGKVVIAPMAGRLLGNPYYTPPGPVYHAVVFKGYDDRTGEFIVNDPGTKHGNNFRYKYEVAYNAIHDWTGDKKTINQGRKTIILLAKNN